MEEKPLSPAVRTDSLSAHIERAGLEKDKYPAAFALAKALLQDAGFSYIQSLKKQCNESELRLAFKTLQRLLRSDIEHMQGAVQNSIADCYYFGDGTQKNRTQAVHWYRKAANQGYASAQNNLGYCYQQGIGVSQNSSQAVNWFQKAANQGHAQAQNNLGYCYQRGTGVEQNLSQAVHWYRKAVNQGNAAAQISLGYCYDEGIGVEQNLIQAVHWYRKAANQSHAQAQYNLGYCYQHGTGVEQNLSQAVHWYRKAAEQGNAGAQNNLGYCYRHGTGVEQNLIQAAHWYRKAANQSHTQAQNNLGYCYQRGTGVEQNLIQAVHWYRKAANQSAQAQNNLGYCYQNGTGVEQNLSQAVHWYRKAAEQGNAVAQGNLGYCYWHSTGVEQNLSQAVHWYQKAANQGYAAAKANLKQLLQSHTKYSDPKFVELIMFLLGALEEKDISEVTLVTRLGQVLSQHPGREALQKHISYFVTTQAVMNNLIQHTGNPTHLSLLDSQDSIQAFLALLKPGSLEFEVLPSVQKGLVQILLLSGPNRAISKLATQKTILGPSLDVSHIQACCEFLTQEHQELIDGLDDKAAPLPQYKFTLDALAHVLNLACHVVWDSTMPWNLRVQNVTLIKCTYDSNLFSKLIGYEALNTRCTELLKDKLIKSEDKPLGTKRKCSIM